MVTLLLVNVQVRFTVKLGLKADVAMFAWSPAAVVAVIHPPTVTLSTNTSIGV